MAQKPCLTCGTPSNHSRCPAHTIHAAPQAPLDRRHERLTRIVITDWVSRYGWVCPGFRRPAHAVPVGKLTGEHIIPRSIRPDLAYDLSNYSVLCGPCNSHKGNRLD